MELTPTGPPLHSLVYMDDESLDTWADVWRDPEPSPYWRCATHELSDGHIVSVMRGSVSAARDSHGAFRATFGRPQVPPGELRARLAAPPPALRELQVRDIVPPAQRAAYDVILQALADGEPMTQMPERPPFTPAEPPPMLQADLSPPPKAGELPAWFNMENAEADGRTADPDNGCAPS